MRVALIASDAKNLYARLAVHLLGTEVGVELTDVLVCSLWNPRRIGHYLDQGIEQLGRKVRYRLLGQNRMSRSGPADSLTTLAGRCKLPGTSQKHLRRRYGFRLCFVPSLNSTKAQKILERASPQLIIYTGGGIVKQQILAIPALGILNAHNARLPQFRGTGVLEWSIIEEPHPSSWITIHLLHREVDTGDILLQRELQWMVGETMVSLRSRLKVLMVESTLDAVRGLRDGSCHPVAQRKEEGHQYYRLHPRLKAHAKRIFEQKLAALNRTGSA